LNLKILHPCPQCGGEVSLEETDRMLACPYCRVRLHMTSEGPFRYALNVEKPQGELIYLPYWRFKGIIYRAVAFKIDPQILDATMLALSGIGAPRSLGLRPQTLPTKFALRTLPGAFSKPDMVFDKALVQIEKQVATIKKPEEEYEKAYIGETASLVFAPYYLNKNTLVDAILNKPLGNMPDSAVSAINSTLVKSPNWEPRFLSAMCPYCGWDLKGDKQACIFVCGGCRTAWQPKGTQFKQVAVGTIVGEGEHVVYLPFWRIEPEVEGMELSSLADLIRIANIPKAVQPGWDQIPFVFWIPAFKVHPHLFLRISRQVTTSPFTGEIETVTPPSQTHAVNLPLAEAVQSLKVVLATFGKPHRTVFQRLPRINIKPKKAMLVFAPCVVQGSELVAQELGFAVSRQALIAGKDL